MTTREINLSRIRPELRKPAWERLQKRYPATAALIQDPLFQALKQAFDAEVIITIEE